MTAHERGEKFMAHVGMRCRMQDGILELPAGVGFKYMRYNTLTEELICREAEGIGGLTYTVLGGVQWLVIEYDRLRAHGAQKVETFLAVERSQS